MTRNLNEPIAIIGSACRFAQGTNSPSELWDLLQKPRDILQEIPPSRFSVNGHYHENGSHHGRTNVKHAYLLDGSPFVFDAEFFGIKPIEAKATDPQQRCLLEVAYEALESAGLPLHQVKGSDTGVYVGAMCYDYSALAIRDLSDVPVYTATGTAASLLSNRLSYFFDWHGPSITIDTACSSSLVAVHLAIQALRSGECSTALACGSNLILSPDNFIIESKLKMLSPDGRSRMWDQAANGYARGEGIGALVLKPLSAALRDNDPIESVIRETAVNQDGASNSAGITVPSASAQEALIRATYLKAGLNLSMTQDQPQFFEAHGTGTTVGDPIEAQAIYNTFITRHDASASPDPPLYVGSIKTILGHTEGTAGLAALMKASLALKNRVIPPNMLLNQLSDRVGPYYHGLEVPVIAKPWPQTASANGIRRASVNSFGFGGANAHAILESCDELMKAHEEGPNFAPFVFSAFSEQSLRDCLAGYAQYLDNKAATINSQDLSWTLHKRRTIFPYRTSFPLSSCSELRDHIGTRLSYTSIATKALPASTRGRILGIFTGQGAQYPRMGAELVEKSELARSIIAKLETVLSQLPDGPEWSLMTELLAGASSSRVYEAAVSQPLCTAVQILLVDLVRLAGIEFDTVIGHSSGEIAAAYASGYITSSDAIQIAYYRGLHSQRTLSPNGQQIKGAMLAVGTSIEDLDEICRDPVFSGRVAIAACNSPSSFTVSGDEDAIDEMQILLEDEGKFNRRLRVDKAYHSDHMKPCFQPYIDSLSSCGLQKGTPTPTCAWISSVYGCAMDPGSTISAQYWAENMTQKVLFSQAIEDAFRCDETSYDLVLELGAHPALREPTLQTIRSTSSHEIPYTGFLSRGTNAIEASSAGLGFAWTQLESGRVDLDTYDRSLSGRIDGFQVVKDLPTYKWNHTKSYWQESRISRRLRDRQDPAHPLLGDSTVDSASHCMSWRNVLSVQELEWMAGHRVQGQVVFPAAGYIVTALEVARLLARRKDKTIRLIDITHFKVHQALVFDTDDTRIETFTQVTGIAFDELTGRLHGNFTFSAAHTSRPNDLTLSASGCLDIFVGQASSALLPSRNAPLPHMIDVETDRFYQALAELGYEFSGHFKALTELKRRHQRSSCVVEMQSYEGLLIHPANLDAVLQACILAYSYPYDQQLRTPHLPTEIRRIRVNPKILLDDQRNTTKRAEFIVESRIHEKTADCSGICGDVNLYSSTTLDGAVQVQGATFLPIGHLGEIDDRKLFSKVHWIDTALDESAISAGIPLTDEHRRLLNVLERIATFYMRKFDKSIPMDDPIRSQFPLNYYLNYCHHLSTLFESGKGEWGRPEWLDDTSEVIQAASGEFADVVDVEIMHLVGSQMPRVFRGETTMLEEFRNDGSVGILDRYYAEGFGLQESAQWISGAVKQITERYPHMNIMEIGAGTGGATKAIFHEIGDAFRSYTYTDISAAFFENASNGFPGQKEKMVFKTFDAERDPVEQGYAVGTYDMIVAFFVIHATSDLERALRNIRKLLKPGGFLVVGEGQDRDDGVTGNGFIFGTLAGWWLGAEKDGRTLSPLVSPSHWNRLLLNNGFSGADISVPASWGHLLKAYHFVTQAVDEKVLLLRDPLAVSSARVGPIQKLVIIGGQTHQSSVLIESLKTALDEKFANEVHIAKSPVDIDFDRLIDINSTVLSLTELDEPVFRDISPETFQALKKLFESGKRIFWITQGRLHNNPFSNMTVGFGRVATNESPDLRLQMFDLHDAQDTNPDIILRAFLRFYMSEALEENFLWATEPEIIMDHSGRQLAPRLLPIAELNDRVNSKERVIIRERNIRDSPIVLRSSAHGYVINNISSWDASMSTTSIDTEELTEIRLMYATSSAFQTPLGHKFLVMGTGRTEGIVYLTLASSIASVMKIPLSSVVQVQMTNQSHQDMFADVTTHLVARAILQPMVPGRTVLVQNATITLSQILRAEAAARGIEVVFVSDSTGSDTSVIGCIRIPKFSTQLDLRDLLPGETAAYVNLEVYDIMKSTAMLDIISSLPIHCRVETAETMFSSTGSHSCPGMAAVLGEILSESVKCVQNMYLDKNTSLDIVQVADLANVTSALPRSRLAIIDFRDDTVPVVVNRLDAQPMFRSTKSTYWIVGMTGALGISLCDWMITKGARYIVITSRKPQVSPEWVASHRLRGATVMVIPGDVTKEDDVVAVHKKICDSLPPIAGVINGAMVLRDVAIRNMSFENLVDVTKPKVEGSIYLDAIFRNIDLDFFVLVSSVNCVIGSWGQANYAAANMFMCGLAADRRRRGLRASVANVGAIIGAGYMERESRRALDAIVQKLHMMRLSEEDWHQAIGEAIEASRLESLHGPEITTGIAQIAYNVPVLPTWASNPKFSAFVVDARSNSEESPKTEAMSSVQDILQGCKSRAELRDVVMKAFFKQLRSMLQLDVSDEDLMRTRSNEIGLDSLVSVDIRSWFLKIFQVSMPVLKILGNNTMASLAEFASEEIPAALIPNIIVSDEVKVEDVSTMISTTSDEGSILSEAATRITSVSELPVAFKKLDLDAGYSINWDHETAVPSSWFSIPSVSNLPPSDQPKVVVLTGATGLLGHHLLKHILASTSVSLIHCLAVRNLTRRLQDNELLLDHRVKYHSGDLSHPLLGLSETHLHTIFDAADVVIHNGADTSHTKFYHDLRDSNVGSTKALVGLCISRQIPFHYISSAGVGLYYNQPEFPEVPLVGPNSLQPPPDGTFGYGCSKWVNEQILEQAHAQFGLPVYIYRPSTIIREGPDAQSAQAELDWVNAMLYYIRKLRAAPKVEHNEGALDLVSVETCCGDILHNITSFSNMLNVQPTYVHQVGDQIIPLPRLRDIEEDTDGCFDLLPMHEWAALAVAAGMFPGVATLIEEIDAPGRPSYPRLLRGDKV